MGIVIKILLISYIYIVSNGLVNRQIADYSLNSSKWPLLLHAFILFFRSNLNILWTKNDTKIDMNVK